MLRYAAGLTRVAYSHLCFNFVSGISVLCTGVLYLGGILEPGNPSSAFPLSALLWST